MHVLVKHVRLLVMPCDALQTWRDCSKRKRDDSNRMNAGHVQAKLEAAVLVATRLSLY